jgi:Ca-activated chloride channel homolog
MKMNAQLDVDVVALQQDDEVTCLLTLVAPVPATDADRPGETLVLVVDRSGSMAGAPLESVHVSLHALFDRLKPQDTFGVVVFDDSAEIAVPTRLVADHQRSTVHDLIDAISPGGSTDLTAGYLLGISEARRHAGETGAMVLLLSDGHANAGIIDPEQVGRIASGAHSDRITTTSIGIGAGYDEALLAEVATQGSGSHRFAFTPDDAIAVVSEEAGDLLSKAVVNAFVRVRPTDPALLGGIGTLHNVPRWVEEDASGHGIVVVPLGDMYAGETRELLVHFAVPRLAALGPHHLADLTIDYVVLPHLTSETITWPMSVNVVPGDEAAARVPDPTVTTARLLAEANEVKRDATEALLRGDRDKAARLMTDQSERMSRALADIDDSLPAAATLRERLAEEQAQVEKLARGALARDAMVSRKSMMEDWSMNASGRADTERRRRSRGKRDF